MIDKKVFILAGILTVGLSSQAALAYKDRTNTYFANGPAASTTVEVTKKIDSNGTVLIDRTSTSPVMIERVGSPPVVIEDRIVKKKHAFKLGIWPVFDFEVR